MRNHTCLATLFATLLPGCIPPVMGCDDFPVEETSTHLITAEDFDAAVGSDGMLSPEACSSLCEQAVLASTSAGGPVTVLSCADDGPIDPTSSATSGIDHNITCTAKYTEPCVGGRRHVILESQSEGEGPTEVAAWMARAAHDESASVASFLMLGAELAQHDAPPALLHRARQAARQEVHHARMMAHHAEKHGAHPHSPRYDNTIPSRSLFELAIENAVEGCVNETFAALLATHQSQHAEDPNLRATFARIAADEMQHGDLAWAIHAWAREQLSDAEAEKLDSALRRAGDELSEIADDQPLSTTARNTLGLPSGAERATLARQLNQQLWN